MMKLFKFLFLATVVVALFVYLQDKFRFLDISVTPNNDNNANLDTGDDNQEKQVEEDESDYVELFLGDGKSIRVNVDIAKTDMERIVGLSNRQYLGDYNGMWFIFDKDSNGPFWMKDMLISLDIIFIDSSGFIVDIKSNNTPCETSYCPIITSSSPYRFVLEVNSNFCEQHGIKIGQSVKAYVQSKI